MPERPCPNHEELARYAAGTSTAEVSRRLGSHVAECAACRRRLESLQTRETSDTVGADPPADTANPKRSRQPIPGMSAADTPQRKSLGEYELIDTLGAGGMGTVYKAWHTQLERTVALKVLAQDQMEDTRAVARFRREMKAVARFDHPNIVRATDAREIDGTWFLVMEYVDGMDLARLVHRLGPLPIADACGLIRQAALGLACAAEHGLVHRDIKPSNLMLARNGQLKILDLGLARIHTVHPNAEAMTAVGQVMGTPDYMAPEQVNDSHAVDSRADVYSLGCTLYMLLAGRPPFAGSQYRTVFEKMVAHTRDPIPPIGSIRPEVPKSLVDLLGRMLAKSPSDRFDDPAQLAEALEPFAKRADPVALLQRAERATGGAPASPTSPAQPETARPAALAWLPARRGPVLVAAALLAVAILSGAILLWPAGDAGQTPDRIANAESSSSHGAARPAPDRNAPKTNSSGDQPAATLPTIDRAGLRGWILLSWTRRGLGKPGLWLISLDGKQHVPLTLNRRFVDAQPCFSPDARRIAFIRGTGPQGPTDLWIGNVDGSDLRKLVSAENETERLISPVWISNSRILYSRDPAPDRDVEMEVWTVDLPAGTTQRVFGFEERLGQRGGLVTDISPNRRQLAVIGCSRGALPTSNVYLTDLEGSLLHTLWVDRDEDYKDARAIWSPDGTRIAWCHYFSGPDAPLRFGVALARLGDDGQWTTQFQSERLPQTTPLAWSPDGRYLLCGRTEPGNAILAPATLLLMDDQLQPVGELFELNSTTWRATQRDFGRLADWAVIPDDAVPESLQRTAPLP